MTATREVIVLWDVEWAHEQAAKALEWLAKNYPECNGAEGLREHDRAVDEAAATGDREAYLEAWRESKRREEVRRREENRDGWLSWYRHLESGYLERAAECGRRASLIEDRGRVSADGRMPR